VKKYLAAAAIALVALSGAASAKDKGASATHIVCHPIEVVRLERCNLASRRIDMPRKRYKPEEIVGKLQQMDVLVSQGTSMADAIRSHAWLGYTPPAPEVFMPAFTAWPAPPPRPAPPATLAQPPALN
jgi:hypothetical protein